MIVRYIFNSINNSNTKRINIKKDLKRNTYIIIICNETRIYNF